MPDVAWNKEKWGKFSWPRRGDEWSDAWGGASVEWSTTILPRIFPLLPVRNAVEIAPGYGRWTSYLLNHCEHLIAADLNANCIDFCNKQFSSEVSAGRCEFYTNDGYTLPGVGDATIDFVFSFDSLVHVEQDVLDSYLSEIARVLNTGGHAFLHHSNLAKYSRLPEGSLGRGLTVSAVTVRSAAEERGLLVRVQEMVTWQGSSLRDCFTLLSKDAASATPVLIENELFWPETERLKTTIGAYHKIFGAAG